MTPLGVIISNTCFRHHNLCKKCVEEAITTFQKIQMIVIGARIYKYRLYDETWRLNIGFRGVLNHIYTSVSSYNLYLVSYFELAHKDINLQLFTIRH